MAAKKCQRKDFQIELSRIRVTFQNLFVAMWLLFRKNISKGERITRIWEV